MADVWQNLPETRHRLRAVLFHALSTRNKEAFLRPFNLLVSDTRMASLHSSKEYLLNVYLLDYLVRLIYRRQCLSELINAMMDIDEPMMEHALHIALRQLNTASVVLRRLRKKTLSRLQKWFVDSFFIYVHASITEAMFVQHIMKKHGDLIERNICSFLVSVPIERCDLSTAVQHHFLAFHLRFERSETEVILRKLWKMLLLFPF